MCCELLDLEEIYLGGSQALFSFAYLFANECANIAACLYQRRCSYQANLQ